MTATNVLLDSWQQQKVPLVSLGGIPHTDTDSIFGIVEFPVSYVLGMVNSQDILHIQAHIYAVMSIYFMMMRAMN
jgi:hypothetical protein